MAIQNPVTVCGVDSDGNLIPLFASTDGTAFVSTGGPLAAMDMRLVRFDDAADMPADITNASNVAADRVELGTYATGIKRVELIWHGLSGNSVASVTNPAALGARIAINSTSDGDADARLVYVDLTGGGTSSAADDDRVVHVSASNPRETVTLEDDLTRVDIIGLSNSDTTAVNPCYVEVRAYS